jgi:lysophospholipase L1-like esterase
LGTAASGPAAVDRLDRDVLGLSGLTDVIWLEGINDLGGSHSIADIERGYQSVVARLHAKGIKVYGATMTSALGISGVDLADNGPGHDANRKILNDFIRHSGLFDGVEDFDAATLDPATGNMKVEFLPNSQFTQLPWDYLHPNHAGYNAMGLAVDIKPFAPRHVQHASSDGSN